MVDTCGNIKLLCGQKIIFSKVKDLHGKYTIGTLKKQ